MCLCVSFGLAVFVYGVVCHCVNEGNCLCECDCVLTCVIEFNFVFLFEKVGK